jgi:hypothetical protein
MGRPVKSFTMSSLSQVLILSAGEDTAGVGISLKQAFDRWAPEWSARAVRRSSNYIRYPADIEWSDETLGEIRELYRSADVLHVMERPEILAELGPTSAKIVVQHLGSYYRNDPIGVSEACQAIGATEVGGGLDLMLQPHLRFLPLPAADVRSYRKVRRSRVVRIAHAPTNRAMKQTAAIIAAVKRLARRHRISFDLIEGQSWKKCLARKSQADIYVDETRLGYGLNAMECWSMGIPVISGIADPALRERMIAEFGALPFYETTEATLEQSIEALVVDPALRREYADRGHRHVTTVHSSQAVIQRTIELYRAA